MAKKKTTKPKGPEIHCPGELLDPANLKPHPANPARHPKEQVELLAKIMTGHGIRHPITVSKLSGFIVSGHCRRDAAILLGLKKYPVVKQSFKDQSEELAVLVADNQISELSEIEGQVMADILVELDERNYPLELTALSGVEIRDYVDGPLQPSPQDDVVPDPPKKAKTKTGDLYILGDHRLLCGDCTKKEDVEKVMDEKKADCVFTSPPYAVGVDYGSYKDTIENLRIMLPMIASLWKKILHKGGFAVVNFGDILSGRYIADSQTPCEYPMALEYWPVFRSAGYVLWARRVWCKPGAAVGSSRHCINTNRAACNYEHVWTWKLPGVPPVNEQISGMWPSQGGWFDTSHDGRLDIGLNVHGAGMPVAVASRSITWHSKEQHIIHEPFAGTGTTLIAAEKLNRRCYGIEIDPAYCDVIVKRFAAFQGHADKIFRVRGGKKIKCHNL